jgi:CheY-like chemotaxis protein
MHAAGLKTRQKPGFFCVMSYPNAPSCSNGPSHAESQPAGLMTGLCYPPADMNILLVEDSDEVRCITVEYLQELGHQVVAVPTAEKAISHLKEAAFDGVMTDIRLPGMSGLELARVLVKNYPKLPIVIASGYGAQSVEVLMGEKLPTVFMLPKPYDLPALEQTLAQAAALGKRI